MKPLWTHQKEAIEKAKDHFAFFFDPGTGKTRTMLEIFKNRTGYESKAIIISPLNVCRNCVNEIQMYVPEVPHVFLASGQSKAHKLFQISEFSRAAAPCFLVVNQECLRGDDYLRELCKTEANFIVADESHNFKNPKSKQALGLLTLVGMLKPKWLYLLTGTPAPQGEIDLYTTLLLLKQTSDNFFIWRKKHFIVTEARTRSGKKFPIVTISEHGKREIHQKLLACSMTANKNEVLDLPELLRTECYFELSKKTRNLYDQMEGSLFAKDGDQEVSASTILTRTLRLQQIAAGVIGSSVIDESRIEALDYCLELVGNNQFLIWTIFVPTYEQLANYLHRKGISFSWLTGDVTAEHRAEAIKNFQEGKLRALIAHPKAGGVGVNLTAAPFSIHYTKGFSLTDDLQCEARNYRGGSEIHEKITRIDVIGENTIDEAVTEALKEKKSVQDFILSLKERYGFKEPRAKRKNKESSRAKAAA